MADNVRDATVSFGAEPSRKSFPRATGVDSAALAAQTLHSDITYLDTI
jgi:hypothetical protein